MRLVVHVPQRLAAERRDRTVAQLADRGWAPEEVSTPFTIGKTHVRYFHPQDRAAAEELAAFLDAEARDFLGFTPSPQEGYLELWLGGQGAPPAAKPVIARRTMPDPVPAHGARSGRKILQRAADGPRRATPGREDNAWPRTINSRNPAGVRSIRIGDFAGTGNSNSRTGQTRTGERGGSTGISGSGGGPTGHTGGGSGGNRGSGSGGSSAGGNGGGNGSSGTGGNGGKGQGGHENGGGEHAGGNGGGGQGGGKGGNGNSGGGRGGGSDGGGRGGGHGGGGHGGGNGGGKGSRD